MTWLLWLAVPVLTPLAAALVVWRRGRPPRVRDTGAALREHRKYLDALVAGPISRDR